MIILHHPRNSPQQVSNSDDPQPQNGVNNNRTKSTSTAAAERMMKSNGRPVKNEGEPRNLELGRSDDGLRSLKLVNSDNELSSSLGLENNGEHNNSMKRTNSKKKQHGDGEPEHIETITSTQIGYGEPISWISCLLEMDQWDGDESKICLFVFHFHLSKMEKKNQFVVI